MLAAPANVNYVSLYFCRLAQTEGYEEVQRFMQKFIDNLTLDTEIIAGRIPSHTDSSNIWDVGAHTMTTNVPIKVEMLTYQNITEAIEHSANDFSK